MEFAAITKEGLGSKTTTADAHVLQLQYQVCRKSVYQQEIMTSLSRDYSLGSYSGPPQRRWSARRFCRYTFVYSGPHPFALHAM